MKILKKLSKIMLANSKKIIATMFILIFGFSLAVTPILAQDDEENTSQDDKAIGCCEKTALGTLSLTTENLTQKKCEEILYGGDATKDYEKTNWVANAIARSNKCEQKPGTVATRNIDDPVYFTPNVSIPESNYTAGRSIIVKEDTSLIAQYIIAIFKYSIGVIAIIAVIVLMIGGVRWLTAGGNSSAIGEAKTMISGSLVGMALAICSFLLLSTINSSLVNFKIQSVGVIQKQDVTTSGCCEKTAQDGTKTAEDTDAAKCNEIKKKDVGPNGYKDVQFFLSQKAQNNKCIETKGCCVLDIGTQIAFLEWPWGDKQVCANNVYEQDCSAQESKGIRNWIPGLGTIQDKDAKPYPGQKCQNISDCKNNLICETMSECLRSLEEKKKPK